MAENKSKLSIVTNGLLKENPTLRLVLGTCPTLAVTTAVSNALGMGAAATVVLICSNFVISALRKVIPDKVHLPCYITIIATFVTLVQMIVKAYAPALDTALGVYLPLIVVNCIILGRAEAYASKNPPLLSLFDGLGMGLGFTLALTLMATVREILGSGTWLGLQIIPKSIPNFTLMTSAPGGFFTFGCLMALVVWFETKTNNKIDRKAGCCAEKGE